ncbi:MAG TPA: hypothetical protein VFD81_03495 [Methylomirabilota bacterium]|nr:hypothetical protein [Methylomirabilota bacterium]
MTVLVAFRSAFRTQVLFTSLLLAACLLASASATAPVSAQEVMTNETVIQMVKAGFSESVILAKMRSSQTKFDTRTDALIELKKAGVPEKVMQAIVSGGAPPASAPAAAASAAPASAMATPAPQGGRRGPIYHVSGGKQVELIGTSGDIETSRAPFSGRKTELVIAGNKAKYRTADRQPVFLTSAEPADVVLVKLDPGKNDRNLRISGSSYVGPYAGSVSQKGIRSEDRVDFEAERDQRGFTRIRPRAPLAPGEFAFVFTRTSGTMPQGVLYDFGVD